MNKNKEKKTKFFIPIIVGVIIVGAFLLNNPIRSLIAVSTMKPLSTQEVMTGIYAVNNRFVNLYVYKCGDQYIVFDGGVDDKATKSALDSFDIDVNNIAAVFLSHTDNDHVAAVSLFPSAMIYMAESNKTFLEESTGRSRSSGFINTGMDFSSLKDGETLTVADTQVQCIYTPGHTDGSASYLVNGKYLFTGDNLHLKKSTAVLFSDVFNMSNDIQEQSLRKLAKLEGIESVFTMHSGYTTDFQTAFSAWR